MKRLWTILLIAGLSLSGVAVAADALLVTPREELDGFVDAVSRENSDARIDGALAFVNAAVVPVRVAMDGKVERFDGEDGSQLAESLRQSMGVFDSKRQPLLQHSVRVEGDHARVTTRVGDTSYEQTVIYELVRHDQRWLIRSVRAL